MEHRPGTPESVDRRNGDVPRRVLVVDDEPTVREVVARYLERDGMTVEQASDGIQALDALKRHPDLVVLDIMIPGTTGLEVLREIRGAGETPVILLTARSDETDRVVGLELGADDYVVKPFSPRELAARVRSVLRRSRVRPSAERLAFEGLVIDTAARDVFVGGQRVQMRPREFDLLSFLAAAPRQVFSRSQILERVWDAPAEFQDLSTITVHVRRLRNKIEADPMHPRWITTVWGVGYRFEP
ncbi:MAG: response regulator transcription factor [Chloroflexi bacterium]|nr:response regulator transcription factor [Chloroflexota bacterium]MDQ3407668.1 response regulator transcription factor [Chloroflexota bacterium]